MNTKKVIVVCLIVALAVALGITYSKYNKEKKEKEIDEKKIKALLERAKKNPDDNENIENQLRNVIELLKQKGVDENIIKELEKMSVSYNKGFSGDVVQSIVKVLETLLKTHYNNNENYITWLKKKGQKKLTMGFHYMIEFCKEEKKITEDEYDFFYSLKNIRNAAAHECNFSVAPEDMEKNYSLALQGMVKIAQLAYPDNIENNV